MVAKISLPLVSKADRALLLAMRPLDIPILLVTLEEGGSGTNWNILGEVARQFHGRYFVLATSEPELSGRMSDKSDELPRVTVINKLDDATPVYRGSLMTEALFEFAEMSLVPLIPKLTDLSKLVELMKVSKPERDASPATALQICSAQPQLTPVKSGTPLGLLLTDNAAERRRLVESLGILAARYRGRINMATVDATELPFLAEPLGVDPGRYPAFVLQSQGDACIHDQSLCITPHSIEELISDCVGDFSGRRV